MLDCGSNNYLIILASSAGIAFRLAGKICLRAKKEATVNHEMPANEDMLQLHMIEMYDFLLGNAMGYIRMVRSGGLHCVSNAIR